MLLLAAGRSMHTGRRAFSVLGARGPAAWTRCSGLAGGSFRRCSPSDGPRLFRFASVEVCSAIPASYGSSNRAARNARATGKPASLALLSGGKPSFRIRRYEAQLLRFGFMFITKGFRE